MTDNFRTKDSHPLPECLKKFEAGDKKMDDLKIGQVIMAGDVVHIKGQIDNGMSAGIKDIQDKLSILAPKIEDNTFWVGKVKFAFIWITVFAVGGDSAVGYWSSG